MLQNRIKKLIAVLILAFVTVSVFADTASLVKGYVNKADAAYEDGDIDNAYRYINSALKLSKAGLKPDEIASVVTMAQFIYKEKLNQLKKNYNGQTFIEIKNMLEEFPDVESATIKKLKEQVAELQETKEKDANLKQQQENVKLQQENIKLQKENMETQSTAMREQTEAMKQQTEITRQAQEENRKGQEQLQAAIQSGLEDLGTGLSAATEENRKSTKLIFFVVLGVIVLILVIVVIAVMLAHRGFKNQELQQAQYVQAFKMLAANQHQTNRLMLGGVTDVYGGGPGGQPLRIAGSTKWEAETLTEEDDNSPETQEALKSLAMQCEEIGTQIDQVTNRKNNSKNVSELVYKIAMHLGLPQGESMLYFCAGMIYDAGYLGVDPELFKLEDLSDEQRASLREHVNLADDHLDFVPKKYWQTFDEAAKNHHENMDGSGYPNGLQGDKIPQVARIIRVCESFVSMTSKRGYRATLDKESAIEKLREQPQFYDPDVIDVLEQIV